MRQRCMTNAGPAGELGMETMSAIGALPSSTRPYKAVILHNLMSDWTATDVMTSEEAVRRMTLGLEAQGLDVCAVQVRGDVAAGLGGLDPREHVIFNWCEGLDGLPRSYDAVPPVLESHGFAYTGAGAWTLATTQDKARTKALMLEHGVPTPEAKVYARSETNGWHRFPALVKPAMEHCSYGIEPEAVVDDPQQLQQRIEYVIEKYQSDALVEDFIDGTEFNVSIWGNGRLTVLPLSEIEFAGIEDYHDRLVSFDAKWTPESDAWRQTSVHCPAEVEPELRQRLETAAKSAYKLFRLRDYGRIDMRVRDGQPYVLDVNSNPDITMEGGFARSARAAGFDYGRMTTRILDYAAKRMPREA